jgi:hypothetical protein
LCQLPLPQIAKIIRDSPKRKATRDQSQKLLRAMAKEIAMTHVQMRDVAKGPGLQAPMGHFIKVPRCPPTGNRSLSASNAEPLYSLAWIDLSEPYVFSHPDMDKRFYLFEMADLWEIEFKMPGTRTTGGAAADYLLTGPRWGGTVPLGLHQIRAETRFMVILGRSLVDGAEASYKIVNDLSEQIKLTPLSAWGNSSTYRASRINPNSGFGMTASHKKLSTRWIRLPTSISWRQ